MKTTLILVVSLTVGAAASSAFGQPIAPTDIEAQHEQGNELRRQHRDEDARVIFQRLWQQTHEPRALARLALAEQSLGRNADSEAHMVEALAQSSDPWIQQNRSVLEGTLQQARAAQGVGLLLVASHTSGAEVFLNGARVGAAGAPIRTSPGSVSFAVRAAGFAPESRTVTLAPGETIRVEVELVAAQARTPTHAPSGPVVPTEPRPAATPSGGLTRTLAWVSAAGAVVFAGVGVAGVLVGSSAADHWNSTACLQGTQTRGEQCGSDQDTVSTMQALSVVGFVGAGALAVTSAALFVVGSGGRTERDRAQSSVGWTGCGWGPGAVGLACRGRF